MLIPFSCCSVWISGWLRYWPIGKFLQAQGKQARIIDFLCKNIVEIMLLLVSIQNRAEPAFSPHPLNTHTPTHTHPHTHSHQKVIVPLKYFSFEALEGSGLLSEDKSKFTKRASKEISHWKEKWSYIHCNMCHSTAQLDQPTASEMMILIGFFVSRLAYPIRSSLHVTHLLTSFSVNFPSYMKGQEKGVCYGCRKVLCCIGKSSFYCSWNCFWAYITGWFFLWTYIIYWKKKPEQRQDQTPRALFYLKG